MENTPCSISVAGKGFNLSAIGAVLISTSDKQIKLSWDSGSLGFALDELDPEGFLDLEILEGGAVQLRLPFEIFVFIFQSPDTKNTAIN